VAKYRFLAGVRKSSRETYGEDKMNMIWKKLAMAAAALFAVSANPAFA
jgi:hypothetical protein